MDFFTYKTKISTDGAFHLLHGPHLCALLLIAVLLTVFVRRLMKMPRERSEKIIRIVAIILPCIEFIRMVWVYASGQTNIFYLLPLHLCGTQIVFIPLAIFTKNVAIKEFVYSSALLGGIAALLVPSGIAEVYPLLHFQTLQSFTLHSILIFIPMAMIFVQGFRPQIKNFPKVLILLALDGLVAAMVDLFTGANYMYLREPPEGTPLVNLYQATGYVGYWIVLLLGMALILFLTYIPYLKQKQHSQEISTSHI